MADLNLIRFLDFYFTLMFFVSLYRRIGQYREMARFALSGPARWPRLFELVKHHRTIFMTWSTILPAFVALAVLLAQLVASQHLWPDATLTAGELVTMWPALVAVSVPALGMFAVDLYFAIDVTHIDRAETEKYFDQAEYWLRSHTAHVVRIFTLGFVDPRQMVSVEVRKALIGASKSLQENLWWLTVQMGFRTACGLAVWLSWVVAGTDS